MHIGGKVVVVVVVVVTTVVFVAGAKENWPMVAYGSGISVCTILDVSEPWLWLKGAEAIPRSGSRQSW